LNTAEALDLAAKTLTIASTALYLLGYIDVDTFLPLVTAAAALISTHAVHRVGSTVRAAARRRWAGFAGRQAETSPCPVCTHPSRAVIEELLEAGVEPERVAGRFPGLGRAVLVQHMGMHVGRRGGDAAGELRQLLVKHLYAALDLYMDGEKLKPREYIAAVNAKLDIIARIKDVTLSMERLRAGEGEKDLTTLLQQLAEEKQEA
jgi:hypothetical protein